MALAKRSHINTAIKYGILVGVAYIIYFILMGVFDLLEIVELSFFSSIFLIIGIVMAISAHKRQRNGMINYFQGLGIGLVTGLVSSLMLAIFLVIYISTFAQEYFDSLQASALFPEGLSMLSLFALTIVYGLWPGLFIAFIAMQWFKRPDHTMPEQI